MKKIVVHDAEKARLDVFLASHLKLSRSQTQKMIADGLVLVNNKPPKKAGDTIKPNDVVMVAQKDDTGAGVNKTKTVALRKHGYKGQKISVPKQKRSRIASPKIIAKTAKYVVVEKPTGLLVHPTQANEPNTLVSWLVKKFPEIKKVGDDPTVRPGIVHRLDKEASGLLVIARTQKMFNHLKEQFKNRTVEKEYWALVHGKVAKDWDILNFPIARSENAERMAARPVKQTVILSGAKDLGHKQLDSSVAPLSQNDSGEKEAKTEFIVEKRFVNFTLLKVILHTGRMHQIRVHMLAYNHPLVGDPLYTQKKRKATWDNKLGRLFLHSAKLGFTDLNGKHVVFESALPKPLVEFLASLS